MIVPYEGSEMIFIAVFQSHPATIPCKSTYSAANVSLWKIHTASGYPEEIMPDQQLGVSFDPRMGFHFESPRWDHETSFLECRVQLGDNEQTSTVSVVWSSKILYLFIFRST